MTSLPLRSLLLNNAIISELAPDCTLLCVWHCLCDINIPSCMSYTKADATLNTNPCWREELPLGSKLQQLKKKSGITTTASNADVKNTSLLGSAVSSGSNNASEDEALWSLKMMTTTGPVTHHHVPEDLNLHSPFCQDARFCWNTCSWRWTQYHKNIVF